MAVARRACRTVVRCTLARCGAANAFCTVLFCAIDISNCRAKNGKNDKGNDDISHKHGVSPLIDECKPCAVRSKPYPAG